MPDSITLDLQACDREQIHLAGGIQPIGVLLILDAANHRLIQASANSAALFGKMVHELPGLRLDQLVGATATKTVLDWHHNSALLSMQPMRFQLPRAAAAALVDMVVHRISQTLQVELLPVAEAGDEAVNLFHDLLSFNEQISQVTDVPTLLARAAREVAAVTGAPRVMVYEFDADFHGTVTFETLAPGCAESYIGLRFPASDIPPQARAMYLKNRIRVIADTLYRPVPLEPVNNPLTGQPVDLTHALLRSVSPVHLEYLGNMGVRGSMSISLVVKGVLWGMILCHHDRPLLVDAEHRNYCEVLGQIISLNVAQLLEIDLTRKSVAAQQTLIDLFPASQSPVRFADLLQEHAQSLCTLLGADGMTVKVDARSRQTGHAPGNAALRSVTTLAINGAGDAITETSTLAAALLAAGLPPIEDISGFLFVPISRDRKDFILFIRREQVFQVSWAGNPHKNVNDEGTGPAPRKSFAKWKETVRGRCTPWTAIEQRCAQQLGILARDRLQVEAIKATREQLMQVEKTASIGQLAAGVAHEINTPIGFVSSNLGSLKGYWSDITALLAGYDAALRNCAGAAEAVAAMDDLKRRIDFDFLAEDTPELISQSREGIMRVRDIIQNLKDFSNVGSENQWVQADLVRAMEATLAMVASDLRDKADVVREFDTLPEVWCIPSQINQVFLNLLINAGQAMLEKGRITVRMQALAEQVVIEISDTGSGIAAEHVGHVFEPFFTTRDVGRGAGLGLSTAYGIVERHNGALTVDSVPGQGATFRVVLPVQGKAR